MKPKPILDLTIPIDLVLQLGGASRRVQKSGSVEKRGSWKGISIIPRKSSLLHLRPRLLPLETPRFYVKISLEPLVRHQKTRDDRPGGSRRPTDFQGTLLVSRGSYCRGFWKRDVASVCSCWRALCHSTQTILQPIT